ncbi:MAG: MarR family transcriptional regulator [Chloroflexota bacterium]|nr:MarR family transcriptional regulator [Chloroflexota bacterium]
MLLDLARASIGNTRVSVSSLAIASAVPSTTALRWIHILEKTAFLEREADPTDARRVYVSITESGRDAMNAYFEAIGASPLAL